MSNGGVRILRKSHIKRYYQDNDPDNSTWVDIERIDELHFVSKKKFPWREKKWLFDWNKFNPDGDNVTKKKIKNPNDVDNWVEVPIRNMVFVTEGKAQQFQAYRHYFVNTANNSTRETHSRRVYHYDIPDDKLDGNKNPPRDPDNYLNALGEKDSDQYVEVEILKKYWTNEKAKFDAAGRRQENMWQGKKWLLDIKDVDPLLKDRDGDKSNDSSTINGAGGVTVDPPWRLDPLQNIVNVSWAGGLAVIFGEQASDAPEPKK